jgi:hypothetical protein
MPEHEHDIRELRAKATAARQFADSASDPLVAGNLRSYAVDLETEAARLEALPAALPPPIAGSEPPGEQPAIVPKSTPEIES